MVKEEKRNCPGSCIYFWIIAPKGCIIFRDNVSLFYGEYKIKKINKKHKWFSEETLFCLVYSHTWTWAPIVRCAEDVRHSHNTKNYHQEIDISTMVWPLKCLKKPHPVHAMTYWSFATTCRNLKWIIVIVELSTVKTKLNF